MGLAGAVAVLVTLPARAQSPPTCPDPTPTAVDVSAVPIVVASTTDDYFVLYASFDVDGTDGEFPVAVVRGEAGTTTIEENIEALPKERYRVEKYLVADPADVDGDCVDDIAELDSLGARSPVNPAIPIESGDGTVAIPDRATFEAMSVRQRHLDPEPWNSFVLKYMLLGLDTSNPRVYFMNNKNHSSHQRFLSDIVPAGQSDGTHLPGEIVYFPNLIAPDGSAGVYGFIMNYSPGIGLAEVAHTLLASNLPMLVDNFVLYIPNGFLPVFQNDLEDLSASRLNTVFDEDVLPEATFLPLNPAEGLGYLRTMDLDERPNSRDIVIYEALPNNLPRVAGIITTVGQTALSHVNLRAIQDGVPNAFIRDALQDEEITALLNSLVRYTVTETGYSIRPATDEEVDAHYESSRPRAPRHPSETYPAPRSPHSARSPSTNGTPLGSRPPT